MNRKLVVALVVIASLALTTGAVYAAGVTADWLRVGTQGEGGVTFFNGTIVNETTGENDADNPVTFGDNVRIDGRVYRGATAGTSDTMPFIVNDNMEVTGSLTAGTLSGTGIVGSDNITDGSVATEDLATSAVTQSDEAYGTAVDTTTESTPDYDILDESVIITTNDSTVLVNFSGVFSIASDAASARTFLIVDGEVLDHTIRRGTTAGAGTTFTLAFNALVDVEAGEHTFQVGWNVNDGETASVYNRTLDVVELKK